MVSRDARALPCAAVVAARASARRIHSSPADFARPLRSTPSPPLPPPGPAPPAPGLASPSAAPPVRGLDLLQQIPCRRRPGPAPPALRSSPPSTGPPRSSVPFFFPFSHWCLSPWWADREEDKGGGSVLRAPRVTTRPATVCIFFCLITDRDCVTHRPSTSRLYFDVCIDFTDLLFLFDPTAW